MLSASVAGLIEFSDDVIWYSADAPYRDVLRAAAAYLDEPGALAEALETRELFIVTLDDPRALLRALDHAVVRLMAELINAETRREDQLDHYAELRAMIRAELALSPEPPP